MSRLGRRKNMKQVMMVQSGSGHPKDSAISFLENDYDDVQPHQDDSMVISIVVADYKVERVLVDQGSSTYVGQRKSWRHARGLIGFAREQVEIRGAIDLRTTFGVGLDTKIVLLRFTVIIAQAFYNIILG
ncbi:hypothetical protein CR513_28361, partial [Mucuna pruriens]